MRHRDSGRESAGPLTRFWPAAALLPLIPHPEERACARLEGCRPVPWPHGSPGDAQHRPETPRYFLCRSLTASLTLGLLGHAAPHHEG
jgi:hypothetical protein